METKEGFADVAIRNLAGTRFMAAGRAGLADACLAVSLCSVQLGNASCAQPKCELCLPAPGVRLAASGKGRRSPSAATGVITVAGDDAVDLSVTGSAQDVLNRIFPSIRGGIGNDVIISDQTSDYINLGPGDDYADLGGLPSGASQRNDIAYGEGGYNVMYCDTRYRSATSLRHCSCQGGFCTRTSSCILNVGAEPGYDWLFGANTDDDVVTAPAGGYYSFDSAGGSDRFCRKLLPAASHCATPEPIPTPNCQTDSDCTDSDCDCDRVCNALSRGPRSPE